MTSDEHHLVGTGLRVRGEVMMSGAELADLRAVLGQEELAASSTLRRWMGGEELLPHSVAVALETQLRMLFGTPPAACALLAAIINRLAEAFPEEVQPLDTA
jgi:hypothetical protein